MEAADFLLTRLVFSSCRTPRLFEDSALLKAISGRFTAVPIAISSGFTLLGPSHGQGQEFLGKPDSSCWMWLGAQCDLVGWDLVPQSCPGQGMAWGIWGSLGIGYDAREKGQSLTV